MLKLNNVYNGDCLDLLKQLPDKSIDVIITDPPYGLKIGGNGKIGGNKPIEKKNVRTSEEIVEATQYKKVEWDNNPLTKEQLDEIFRVSENQIIFGFNYFLDILPPCRCFLVWDKKLKNNWEDNFSDCEIAWTSFDKPARVYRHLYMGALKKTKEKRYHPTQKPLEVMEWIINKYTNENDVICDPFSGSGTTLVASAKLKRKYIGIELDEDYCKVAKERIKQETKQQTLF